MSEDNVNAAVIEQISEALERSREQLDKVSREYRRLKAEVIAYERTLDQLTALEEGAFDAIVGAGGSPEPQRQRDTKALKQQLYEYFAARPRLVQSPRGVAAHLQDELGWDDKGLRVRVSNMLRKIEREESWLEKQGHGKYQFVPE